MIHNALIMSIDPNVDVDSWMVLQGGHVARRWTGDARQSGCKTVLQGVTSGKGVLQGMEGKENMMLQYLPVLHTTANRATPPNGRDCK